MHRPASMTTVANSADDILPRFRMVYTKKVDVYDADAEAAVRFSRLLDKLTLPPPGFIEREIQLEPRPKVLDTQFEMAGTPSPHGATEMLPGR
jgi:hypothetical protein